MIVQDIYNIIDRFAPFATASSWDNAGTVSYTHLLGHVIVPV